MRRLCAAAAVLGLLTAAVALGAEQGAGPPTAAILAARDDGLRDTLLVAMLEAGLPEDGTVQLVERARIDSVLEEQALQDAFSAPGVGQRVRLGQLLKTDLLVLLRAGGKGEGRYVQVVVAETGSGLRLLARPVPRVDGPETTVARIRELVREALGRFPADDLTVVAIPPLLSKDLTHRYDHLQSAYARLIEQTVLGQPGFVIVELEEARALVKEMSLIDPGGRVQRSLPLHITGEFRHGGPPDAATVTVTMQLSQGGDVIREESLAGAAPSEVAPFLRRTAGAFLAGAAGTAPRLPDPEADADQLAARAQDFLSIGNWAEGLALTEACLLLRPGDADLHLNAIGAASGTATQGMVLVWSKQDQSAGWRRVIAGYHAALDHLGPFLLHGTPTGREHSMLMVYLGSLSDQLHHSRLLISALPPEEKEALARARLDLARRQHQVFLEALEYRVRGTDPEVVKFLVEGVRSSYRAPSGPPIFESSADEYSDRLQAIHVVSRHLEHPYARRGWVSELAEPRRGDGPPGKEYERFLDAVADVPIEEAPVAVAKIRDLAERRREPRPVELASAPVPDSEAEVLFTEIDFAEWIDVDTGAPPTFDGRIRWQKVAPGLDVIWNRNHIYVMSEPGRLRQVQVGEGRSSPRFLCYDGKRLWVGAISCMERNDGVEWEWCVIAVDPGGGPVHVFGRAEGLPDNAYNISAAPLAPGRICVASATGDASRGLRSWIAVLEIDEDGGKTVDVIHEARRALPPRGTRQEELDDIHLGFEPMPMVVWPGTAEHPGKLLVLPRIVNQVFYLGPPDYRLPVCYPLLVDPDAREVSLLRTPPPRSPWALDAERRICCWLRRKAAPAKAVELMAVNGPSAEPEVVAELSFDPRSVRWLMLLDGEVHVVGKYWWRADAVGEPFRLLRGNVPGDPAPVVSAHYGLVAVASSGVKARAWRVTFAATGEGQDTGTEAGEQGAGRGRAEHVAIGEDREGG